MNAFQPTGKRDRLAVVDALRGLALLCILIANIPFAGENASLYQSGDFVLGSPKTDSFLNAAFHLLIDKKFVAIFSILFGFGFYIQMQKAEENNIAFRPYFFKRMIILMLIACIHAYVFWFGDIIRDYALCGMFLLFVYKWPVKRILITAIVFIVFLTSLIFIANGALGLQEYSYDPAIITEHPTTTSYLRYLQINATVDPFRNFVQDSPLTLVFAFGNMLLGFWMAKSGFFHQPKNFNKILNRLIITGAIFGLTCSYLFWKVTTGELELTPALIWLPFIIVAGMLMQSLFYISTFVKLFQYPFAKKFLLFFEPVGKMALTNYMLQSVFYCLIFFHWTNGLKLYGKLTLTETYLVAILLFCLQVLLSRWWLSKHKQGPVEYLWKRVSYGSRYSAAGSSREPSAVSRGFS
jgi:uncharacterized protein